ncbi:MAG: NUDIX domain-containing protein [Thermoleophilia bacterium]
MRPDDQAVPAPEGGSGPVPAGEGSLGPVPDLVRDPAPDVPGGADKPTIRVAGLLVHEGRILMVEQGHGEERYWLLPGGGVQFGETLSEALRREFQEELGLRVGVYKLLAIVESISPDPSYAKHVVHLVFEVSAPAEVLPEPRDVKVLSAEYLDELELQRADVRPPITEFLSSCVRELPSSPQYLGRRW